MLKVCVVILCFVATVSAQLTLDAVPSLPTEPKAVAALDDPLATTPAPAALVEASAAIASPTGRRGNTPVGTADDKLDVALNAIKQDILVRNRQIQDERHWVKEVKKITDTYEKKIKRVVVDIKKTKNEVRDLFRKKKQIENLKIQRELEKKLSDATSDLGTLQSALHHVHTKEDEFAKTKNEVKRTILNIQLQLAKLKGDRDPRKIAAIHEKVNNL